MPEDQFDLKSRDKGANMGLTQSNVAIVASQKTQPVESFDDKRRLIQCAAEKLFARHRFQATTVRAVAHEAGVNMAVISYYFTSKQQLLYGILINTGSKISLVIEQLLGSKLSDIDKLHHLIDFYTVGIFEYGTGIYILLQEQLVNKDPFSRSLIDEINMKQLKVFEQIIRSGVQNGQFKSGLYARMVRFNILGMIQCIIMENKQVWIEGNKTKSLEFKNYMSEANSYLKEIIKNLLLTPN